MKNGIIRLLFVSFILFIPMTIHAEPNEPQTYHVGTTNLLIRAEPSPEGRILGKLHTGNEVVVFKEQYGWAQTYYQGEEAWIAAQYLITPNTKQSNTNSSEPAGNNHTVEVIEDESRLRSGPGTEYKVVHHLHKGTKLNITETDGDWYKVKTSGGEVGWLASWLTTKPLTEDRSVETNTTEVTSSSLEGIRVVLDAGHGGEDPGAIGINQVYEKNLALITTEVIQRELTKAGAEVIMTRTGDYYVSLDERARRSNANNPDVFISIHYNAFLVHTTNGFSTHYFDSGKSKTIAHTVQTELRKQLPTASRGIMNDDYYVLRHTASPAILIELGFLTNFQDMHTIQTTNYSERAAAGIKNALIKYFQ